MRAVIDTNVLVASAYQPLSASRRLIEHCEAGAVRPLVSPDVEHEYAFILPRAVRRPEARERIFAMLNRAERVTPAENPRVSRDRDDDKFLAVALAGGADALVTNDDHLLCLGRYEGIPILRPVEVMSLFSAEIDA